MQKSVTGKRGFRGILAAAAVFAVTAVLLLFVAGISRVREVTVLGNVYYTKEQITEMLIGDGFRRSTLYLYIKYTYGKHPQIPFIDTFEVKVDSLDSVTIRVYEKSIVGYVRYLGKNVYFDKDGIVVESSSEQVDGIPMISGLSFRQLAMYRALDVEDEKIFNTILSITQLLKKYKLEPDEIRFGSADELYLTIQDVRVALGAGDHMDEKVARLKQLENDLAGKSGTLHMENYTDESSHISLEVAK